MKTLYNIVLFFALLMFASNIFAQQTQLENGIQLYKQGKNSEAITVLERLSKQKETKTDVKVWNYLGLAYIEADKVKKARTALEKAVSLSPQNSAVRTNLGYAYLLSNKSAQAQAEFDKAIEIEPLNYLAYFFRGTLYFWQKKLDEALANVNKAIALNVNLASAYTLKSNILISKFGSFATTLSTPRSNLKFLNESVETLEYCLKNCQNNLEAIQQQEKLAGLREFYEYYNRDKTNNTNFSLDTDTDTSVTSLTAGASTPLKITFKPRAGYTNSAREAGVSGTVSLLVLFAANGKVSRIMVLQTIGYGLDAQAMKAASQIRFEPMMKDGKPVSTVKMVKYTFTIY